MEKKEGDPEICPFQAPEQNNNRKHINSTNKQQSYAIHKFAHAREHCPRQEEIKKTNAQKTPDPPKHGKPEARSQEESADLFRASSVLDLQKQTIQHPTYLPTYQPASHPSNQPASQPTNQPTSHPANQPTNQPTNLTTVPTSSERRAC